MDCKGQEDRMESQCIWPVQELDRQRPAATRHHTGHNIRGRAPMPLPDAEGKVLYVWFDAPVGVLSATKS